MDKWPERHKPNYLDHWHVVSGKLRRAMKGWGANFESEMRRHKQTLLLEIKEIDDTADTRDLSGDEWAHRYNLEQEP